MAKGKIFKTKEKYISERTSAKGTKLLRIQIRAYGQTYSKSIDISKFDTPKQAMELAKKLRDEALVKMQAGYTVSNFKTVEEIYQKSFEVLPVRKKTIIRHGYFYKKGIAQYGNKSIDKITTADIQASINNYAKTHTKRQVDGLLSVWRRIYKTAFLMNMSISDRTVAVIIPECKQEHPKKKDISTEDFETFCDVLLTYNTASRVGAYDSVCIYHALQIMRYCGLRPAETFALTKQDIHVVDGGGYISINKASHSTVDSMLEIGKTKTQCSVRNVSIPHGLTDSLSEWLDMAKYDLLFADYYGNLRDIDNTSDYIHRVAKKAKVQFNMYMLRHQLSTDLFKEGIPPQDIRDIMGHKSANMSLDYAVSSESDRENALNSRRFS